VAVTFDELFNNKFMHVLTDHVAHTISKAVPGDSRNKSARLNISNHKRNKFIGITVKLPKYREFIRCLAVVCMSWKYATKRSLRADDSTLFKRRLSGGTSARSLTSQTKCYNTN